MAKAYTKIEPMSRALRPGGEGVVAPPKSSPPTLGSAKGSKSLGKGATMPKMPRIPGLKAPRAPQMPKMPRLK